MNQFKRAKQNGHQMESITDLKTAGVTKSENIEKKQMDKINNEEKDQPITKNISTDSSVTLSVPNVTVEAQNTLAKETPISLNEEQKTGIINENDIKLSEDIAHTEVPMNVTQTSVYNEPIVIAQSQNMQQQISVLAQPTQPVQQYIEYDTTYNYAEANTPKTKTSKKNVPNMFVQKSESKSIRKSLVLRPSSVKIAENYCSKNGGSFNELIQILLDKFIEEYGL